VLTSYGRLLNKQKVGVLFWRYFVQHSAARVHLQQLMIVGLTWLLLNSRIGIKLKMTSWIILLQCKFFFITYWATESAQSSSDLPLLFFDRPNQFILCIIWLLISWFCCLPPVQHVRIIYLPLLKCLVLISSLLRSSAGLQPPTDLRNVIYSVRKLQGILLAPKPGIQIEMSGGKLLSSEWAQRTLQF
jgi:hypothetical protein